MRHRLAIVVSILALLATACGGSDGFGRDIQPQPGAQAMLLSYQYTPGGSLAYDFEMAMDVVIEMDGGEMFGGGLGPTEMTMRMLGTSGYELAEGPDPGTTRITLTQSIDAVDVSKFVVDGQSLLGMIDDEMASAMALEQGALPEMAVIVDERGNIVSFELDGEELSAGLFGDMGSSLDPTGGLMGLDGFFGPAFPENELRVGDMWTVEDELDVPFFGQALQMDSRYQIVAEDELGGRNVLVIESQTDMGKLSIDMMDLMRNLGDADPAELEALGMSEAEFWAMFAEVPADFGMTIEMEPDSIVETVWFDPGAGVMVKSEGKMAVDMVMEMDMFGEKMKVDMRMLIDIYLDLREIAEGTAA